MSYLKPGTICIAIGGSGVNAGRIVRVIEFTGEHEFDPRVTEGYLIEALNSRPFTTRVYRSPGDWALIHTDTRAIADRRRLRPLVDVDTVEDNAPGVPLDVQQEIFTEMQRDVLTKVAIKMPDFIAIHDGSISVLTPMSAVARTWCEENLPEDAPRWGDGYAIEHRYVFDILAGIQRDNMTVR